MTETKLTYKVNEKGLIKILVDVFNETKNTDWILELLLCYDDNQKLLEELGVSLNDIKTFSTIKRSKAKVVVDSIKLQRLSEIETSTRIEKKRLRQNRISAVTQILKDLYEENE